MLDAAPFVGPKVLSKFPNLMNTSSPTTQQGAACVLIASRPIWRAADAAVATSAPKLITALLVVLEPLFGLAAVIVLPPDEKRLMTSRTIARCAAVEVAPAAVQINLM